jgi:hypothetical protein
MSIKKIFFLFRICLESRYLPLILAGIGFAMALPALNTGLLNDDYCHWAKLAGPSLANQRLLDVGIGYQNSGQLTMVLSDLFITVQPGKNLERLKSYGALPWWTYDGLKFSFWRPLSSLTHWLDYRLFPNSVFLMHAHNFFWLASVIFLMTIFYRSLIATAWVAGLAAVLYMLDDNSYFPSMWIANRNVLITLSFGVLTLLVHQFWRKNHSYVAAIAAPFCLLAALLSAEAGLATFAYLFAYAIVLERGSLVHRILSLLPYIFVIVLWRLFYNLGGFGASGGAFYFDPIREPLLYTWAVIKRGPFILAGQWSSLPIDIFTFMPDSTRMWYWFIMVVFVFLFLLLFFPLVLKDRLARFWLLGMFLSSLPVCATVPMSRNLLFVGIGGFGLIAQFAGGVISKGSWLPKSNLCRTFLKTICIILLCVHLPLTILGRITGPKVTSLIIDEVEKTMDVGSLPGLEDKDLIVVNVPNPASFSYIPFFRAYKGESLPKSIRILSPGFGPLEVIRTGKNSLRVISRTGSLLVGQRGDRLDHVHFYKFVSNVCGPGHTFETGQRIELPKMKVDVINVDDNGMPVEVLFCFEVSLDNASLSWLKWDWDNDSYVPFSIPDIGERSYLPGPF